MEKKYVKILIIVTTIVIVLLTIIIFLLKKDDGLNMDNLNVGEVGDEVDYSDNKEMLVTEKVEYYIVRNCINDYLNSLNTESSIYYLGNEYNEEVQKEKIYNILSTEFVEQQNITKENVLSKVETISQNQIFVPLKMKVLEKENVNKYVAYGVIQTLDNEFISRSFIIVNIDLKNKTYSIEPIKEHYENIEEISIENNNISIEKNDYNVYDNPNITNEYITNEYFVLLKRLLLTDPDTAYGLMESEYKDLRFGDINEFKNYINDNKEEILKVSMKQYLVNNYEDHIEYVAKDQFGNLYIFNEYENQKIDIKLDTYTLGSEVFAKEYNKSSNEDKVKMNIDKFIQMINRHDYRTSYDCIAESFKNNYFKTQKDFENYIKNNFYDYNKFEFQNCEKKGLNLYVCKIQISDLTGKNLETKEIDIIMQLNDGLDFDMSFSI